MSGIDIKDDLQQNEIEFLINPENLEKISFETVEELNLYLVKSLNKISDSNLEKIIPIINKLNDKFKMQLRDSKGYYNFAIGTSHFYSNDSGYNIYQTVIGNVIISKLSK